MPVFTTRTGERLSYRVEGDGPPVLVVPGGPGRDADYLEGLGGLAARAHRRVVTLEPRGTGASPRPATPAGYSAVRTAEDLDDLRVHLGLTTIDVIAHSAGCAVAFLYAAAHPDRVGRLVLLTPSTAAVGLLDSDEEWERRQDMRRHETWFADASAAMTEIDRTGPTPELRRRVSPLLYGTWDARAQAHAATDASQRNADAAAHAHDDLPDPAGVRTRLAAVGAPVRVVIGGLDLAPGPDLAADVAALFPAGAVLVQPCAGHFPWVDDAEAFTDIVGQALTR